MTNMPLVPGEPEPPENQAMAVGVANSTPAVLLAFQLSVSSDVQMAWPELLLMATYRPVTGGDPELMIVGE